MKFYTQKDILDATYKQDRSLNQNHIAIKDMISKLQQKDSLIYQLENKLEISNKQLALSQQKEFTYFQNNNQLILRLGKLSGSQSDLLLIENAKLKNEVNSLLEVIRNSREWQKKHGITELKELIKVQQLRINQLEGTADTNLLDSRSTMPEYIKEIENVKNQLVQENYVLEMENESLREIVQEAPSSVIESQFHDNESLQSQINWLSRENEEFKLKYAQLKEQYDDLHQQIQEGQEEFEPIEEESSTEAKIDSSKIQDSIAEFQQNYLQSEEFIPLPSVEQETLANITLPSEAEAISHGTRQILEPQLGISETVFTTKLPEEEAPISTEPQLGCTEPQSTTSGQLNLEDAMAETSKQVLKNELLHRKLELTQQQAHRYQNIIVANKNEVNQLLQTISTQKAQINALNLRIVDLEFQIEQTEQEASIWGQSSQNAVDLTNRLLQSTEQLRKSLCSDED